MNQNSLLALVTLIALLWINGGDCQKEAQNENEVDIAKRQKGGLDGCEGPDPPYCKCYCDKLKKCEPDCAIQTLYEKGKYNRCLSKCGEMELYTVRDCKKACKVRSDWGCEAEMADEADEAKSDEVDIAKRQKGLKILKAWKRDEAEMAAVDEADEDKAQN